jgi:large subunit ribosomal protein L32
MAVPKKRHTKSRRNRRRSHDALKETKLSLCPKCKESILPHRLCASCGTYKGREVIDVLAKLTKKERKKKEKEMDKKGEKEPKEDKKAKPLNLEELSKK